MGTLVRWQLASLANLIVTIVVAESIRCYRPQFDAYHYYVLSLLIPGIFAIIMSAPFLASGNSKTELRAAAALYATCAVPMSVYLLDMPLITGTLLLWCMVIAYTALLAAYAVRAHKKRAWPWPIASMIVFASAYHWAMRAVLVEDPILIAFVAAGLIGLIHLGAKRWGGEPLPEREYYYV
jgi:hypothetical protein